MKRLRGPFAVLLCLGLTSPSAPMLADTDADGNGQTSEAASKSANSTSQLQGDARILHALNRFTFGPRPGDLEAVRQMGLEQWFNRQLHPERLDQAELDARLADFPAMQANPQDLLFRLPSNAVIRQAIDGKISVPQGVALHAVYANEMARVELRKQAREQKKEEQPDRADGGTIAGSVTVEGGTAKQAAEPAQTPQSPLMSMNSTENNPPSPDPAIAQAQIAGVLTLAPQRRVNRLVSMTQPEFDTFRKSLKPQQRKALLTGLSPAQKELVAALENPQRLVADELASQRLMRDIYSSAQLQEVMTDFWLNHFNVYLHNLELVFPDAHLAPKSFLRLA